VAVPSALTEAQRLVEEIYALTAALQFSESAVDDDEDEDDTQEQDIAAYAKMVEDRDPLVAQLTALSSEVGATVRGTREFTALRKRIDEIASLDKQHLSHVEKVRDDMRGTIKGMKHGRQMREAYSAEAYGEGVGYFDTKQ